MPPTTGDTRKRSIIATKANNTKSNASAPTPTHAQPHPSAHAAHPPTTTANPPTRSHLTVSSSQDYSPSPSSSSHRAVSPRTPSLTRESLSANSTPRPRRHSHSDRPDRSQQSSPSSDGTASHPPIHHSVTRQVSLASTAASDKPTRTKQQATPTNNNTTTTRNRNSSLHSSPLPTPTGTRRQSGQAWSGPSKATRPTSRSFDNDRSSTRSSTTSSKAGHKDEELDVLLDALMPRLVRRMQHALEHIKPFTAASTQQLSSSSYISSSSQFSSSASFDSNDSTSPPTADIDQLVQRGVVDTLQQLFVQLLSPRGSHEVDETLADVHSEEVSIGGGSSVEYVVPPSMQLLGDVSYHAGSTVSVGQQVMKVWSVKNNGDTQWPEQVRLLPSTPTSSASSSATAHYSLESDAMLFTDLLPGDTMNVSVLITVPAVAGRHVAHYQLAFCQPADKLWVRFGDELTIDLVCHQSTTSSSTSASSTPASTSAASAAASAAADKANTSADQPATAQKKLTTEETKHSTDIDNNNNDSSSSMLDTSSISELVPSHIPRRPLSRSGDVVAEREEKERRKERKKDKLRVERGKDRSQSVDSKPPTLSSNDWWGLVHADAVRATGGSSVQAQPSAAAAVAGGGGAAATARVPVLESPSHLMSFGPSAATADDEEALDWLKHASGVPQTTAAPTAAAITTSAASAPSVARNLTAAPPGALHLTSRSANHSRSNSPALPPSTVAPSSVPMFARSTSQSFPPAGAGGSTAASGELLSPPLTPTVPSGSMLSKDDLMSWAGGQGLITTNKQTGVQSQSATQPPTLNTASATSAAPGPPATPLASSLSHSYSTLPRQTSSNLSPSSTSRSRHSMPPTARIVLPSSSSAFNLSTQQHQQQQQQSSSSGGGGGGGAAGQSNIPDFLKEETARLSSGKQ